MTESFRDLGLAPALIEQVEAAGWLAPTALQRAAIPVLRRGGNAVLFGSSGAGLTGAYGLSVLDRLAGEEVPDGAGPRALIVVSTEERAAELASTLANLAARTTARVAALAPGWRNPALADVVVAAAATVARALSASALKLDGLRVVVLEDASVLIELEGEDAIRTLMIPVPGAAQRVVTTPEMTAVVDRFVETQVHRAITIPPRPADPSAARIQAPRGELSYIVTPAAEKLGVLGRILARERESTPVVALRTPAAAQLLARALGERGFRSEDGSAEMDVAVRTWSDTTRPARIGYDVPADARELTGIDLQDGVVLVTPRELPHLRRIAAESGITLKAIGAGRPARDALSAYRGRIERALAERDLDAQLLVLAPLFERYDPAEVAAALSALLRERGTAVEESGATQARPSTAPPPPPAFVRLFVGVGNKDNIRPGDLVGAMTGEANVTADQIGRIEIRDTFSVVEVQAHVADRVIAALNGTTMRGRSVRVDYDRKSSAPPPVRRGPRRPRSPG